MDIASAYPAEAGVISYNRDFVFKHGEDLTVQDSYRLKTAKAPLTLNFLCYERPEPADGRVLLSGKVEMEYGAGFKAEVEELLLKDEKIRGDWKKDALYRLRLTKEALDTSGTVTLRFTRLK
jgi:hypothetical protein